MLGEADHLASIIAAHLRHWNPSPPFFELDIFRSADATAIARAINLFCMEHLDAAVARGLFHQSSIGCVTGVLLADGRLVVVKAHQPSQPQAFLADVIRIQSYLAARGVLATQVLAGPLPLGQGHTIVESFTAQGSTADAHDPEVRQALAGALHRIVTTCDPLVGSTSLEPALLRSTGGTLWPTA